MSFDEEIEKAYIENKKNGYLASCDVELEMLREKYPAKYMKLLALRASVIKWDLIVQKKISRYDHGDSYCGLCNFIRYNFYLLVCAECPLYEEIGGVCYNPPKKISARKMHKILYKLYMQEHKKLENKGGQE